MKVTPHTQIYHSIWTFIAGLGANPRGNGSQSRERRIWVKDWAISCSIKQRKAPLVSWLARVKSIAGLSTAIHSIHTWQSLHAVSTARTQEAPGSSPVPPAAFLASLSGYSARSAPPKASPWGCRICSSCEKHNRFIFFRPIARDCLFSKARFPAPLVNTVAGEAGALSSSVLRPGAPNEWRCAD